MPQIAWLFSAAFGALYVFFAEGAQRIGLRVEERTSELAKANHKLQAEIAERRHAEEVLRNQASLLDLAHDASIVRDLNDVITYWNFGAEETYGWPRRHALGTIAEQLLQSVYPSDIESLKGRGH